MDLGPAVSAMWLEAFFAAYVDVVFRDLHNGTVQPMVGTVIDSRIEARADSGDG